MEINKDELETGLFFIRAGLDSSDMQGHWNRADFWTKRLIKLLNGEELEPVHYLKDEPWYPARRKGVRDMDKKTMKVTIVYCDDWIAIYKDGKLKAQNHSLSPREVLEALEIPFESEIADEFAAEVGHLPNNLSEVRFDD